MKRNCKATNDGLFNKVICVMIQERSWEGLSLMRIEKQNSLACTPVLGTVSSTEGGLGRLGYSPQAHKFLGTPSSQLPGFYRAEISKCAVIISLAFNLNPFCFSQIKRAPAVHGHIFKMPSVVRLPAWSLLLLLPVSLPLSLSLSVCVCVSYE